MARERSIVVRLRAEVSDFQNKMGQASRSLSDFERGQQKLGGAADTTMGRLVQSARINEREWTNVGQVLATTGGLVSGLGIAALNTGVQYNTLQQTTRAALTTLTGSAEDANAQMDKLDDFASNSPFAKDVFIKAQQQMLGFGIEAQKVVPYLSAIQDSVAATGGSNQDIAELSSIFSKIQSSAKITAQDLMEFGNRGVDAATLIGSQMGKTGAQIREDITDGTLDAGEALDALAAGMDERFGGAAANVKNTFAGAVDRVKAAWRDLGSTLATPLVDPQGGGLLIDFFNGLADAMRAFEGAPTWVQGAVVGLGALAGAAALAGGAFMIALPRFVEFRTSVQTLRNAHPVFDRLAGGIGRFATSVGRIAGVAGILAGVTIAVGALIDAVKQDVEFPGVNQLSKDLMDLADAGKSAAEIDLTDLLSELPEVFGIATIEADNLGDVLDTVLDPSKTDQMAMFFGNFLPSYMNDNIEIVEGLDEALVNMINAGGNQKSAAIEFMDNLGYEADELAELLPGATDALVEVEAAAEGTGVAAEQLGSSLSGITASAEDAEEAIGNWATAMFEAGGSFGGIIDAFDAVIEKQGEARESGEVTMNQWIDQMQKQAEAVGNWRDNTIEAIEQIEEDVPESAQKMHLAFVKEMVEAGEAGAEALQTFVDATPEQRQELVDAWSETGPMINEVIEAGLEPVGIEADTEPAFESHSALLDHIMESTPFMNVDADTTLGRERVDQMLGDWGSTLTQTNVDANTGPANSTYDFMTGTWRSDTTDTNLDANTGPAQGSYNFLTGRWMSSTTDTNLDANTGPAQGSYNFLTGRWNASTTDTNLGANTNPASRAFQGQTRLWSTTTTSTRIGADTSPAQRAWNAFKSTVGNLTTRIFTSFTGGNYHGGFVNPGKYEGGTVLPGRQAGGTVPGPRAGRDNILWPLHSGGQILSQPLEGGEFVVRSSKAHMYEPELWAMNNGTFPTGMMERLYSSNTAGPMSVQVAAPPVDTAAIGAAVATAIQTYRPIVQIGNREFHGVMREVSNQFRSL